MPEEPKVFEENEAEPVWTETETSQEFQILVSKLVHQHLKEVALLEKQKASLKESVGEMMGELTRLRTNDLSKMPKAPQSPDAVEARSTSWQGNKYKKKGTSVVADQILEVFEGDPLEVEDRFETDFGKLLRGVTRYETSETEEDRDAELTFLQRLRMWLQSNAYDMSMAFILCLNVLWMALESQIDGLQLGSQLGLYPTSPHTDEWELSFMIGDLFFTSLFALDVLVRICILQRIFFRSCMNYVDLTVSVTSLVEMTVTRLGRVSMSLNPVLFRLLRIGKLFRAVRMVHMTNMLASLHLLVKCLIASCNMLFWSFCLLTFLQCVAGLIISTLCKDFIASEMNEAQAREDVFLYFGTFSRTFLTMFEILFANWGPPCRLLVENISEWFSVLFLLYRCVLGFAVLNVVNAVFVQQTMKTASTDEELAFKQKEKDIALYTRKVRGLFQTMDASGDGAINLEEFAKLVKSPKLKFWMSQLELEYHDLLSLFEFLDNGDGEITLMEFIEGAGRLRGNAKALDIWRVETKLEVLFERVLRALPHLESADAADDPSRASVQQVFDHSVCPNSWIWSEAVVMPLQKAKAAEKLRDRMIKFRRVTGFPQEDLCTGVRLSASVAFHRVSLEPGLSSRMNGASEQSSPGFLNLPGVKTTKPELLENKFESLVEPVWEETSQEFQLLVSKLVHQHVKEVSLLEKQKASLKVSIGEMEGELTRLQTKEAIKTPKTPQSGDGDGLDCRSASLQRSRYKKKGTTVIADQILEVFEGDNGIEVEKKFETDFGKLLRAGTKYETSETEEDRVGDLTFFQRLRMWLQSNAYDMCMAFILCLNVLWMALESQIDGLNLGSQIGIYPPGPEQWELSFMIGDVFFTSLFALDVLVRICVLQRLFFKSCMNYVDLVVSATSLAEMTLTVSMSLNPVLFRLLRIGKLFRAVRMVHMTNMLASLHLLVKCLIASCNMLFWSFCLLTFLQCVSGLVISTLCKDYIASEMHEMKAREDVFLYFGTFTRTFLTMFEILFANWGPPCRVLIENVSEWFSVFFLLYRCVLGFAVVNVVNAVFVQQTMKTASTDEELAFKQKEKETSPCTLERCGTCSRAWMLQGTAPSIWRSSPSW
ncbi:unnamed protein product [Effrenium voratum]|uniref:EF-hand domain-containing protein n=1 Tax=Effrenium voratum TaxID=2562239 RepID=A0AA36J8R4_9DINO|nr:unnamed protein product [Effrenium voratum]